MTRRRKNKVVTITEILVIFLGKFKFFKKRREPFQEKEKREILKSGRKRNKARMVRTSHLAAN
jgi:hypothetical protein